MNLINVPLTLPRLGGVQKARTSKSLFITFKWLKALIHDPSLGSQNEFLRWKSVIPVWDHRFGSCIHSDFWDHRIEAAGEKLDVKWDEIFDTSWTPALSRGSGFLLFAKRKQLVFQVWKMSNRFNIFCSVQSFFKGRRHCSGLFKHLSFAWVIRWEKEPIKIQDGRRGGSSTL